METRPWCRLCIVALLAFVGLALQVDPVEKEVLLLVRQLASEVLTERDRATEKLKEMGGRIVPILRHRLTLMEDAETAARLRAVIDALDRPTLVHVKDLDLGPNWNSDCAAATNGAVWIGDGRGDRLRTYETERWSESAAVELDVKGIRGLVVSPSGARVAVAGSGRLLIIDRATRSLKAAVDSKAVGGPFRFLDEDRLVVLVTDGPPAPERLRSRIHRILPKEKAWVVEEGPDVSGFGLAVSPDGRWMAVSDLPRSRSVKVIEASSGKGVASLSIAATRQGPQGTGHGIVFTPDSRALICEGWNGDVTIYSTATWTLTAKIEGNLGQNQLVVTADSKNLLYLGEGPTLRLWSLRDRNDEASIKLQGVHQRLLGIAGRQVLIAWSEEWGGFRRLSIYRVDRP